MAELTNREKFIIEKEKNVDFIYKQLKIIRIYYSLTQREVAEKIGITHSSYARYERKERRLPIEKYYTILSIIISLGIKKNSDKK